MIPVIPKQQKALELNQLLDKHFLAAGYDCDDTEQRKLRIAAFEAISELFKGMQTKVNGAATYNKTLLKMAKSYKDIAKDRSGADPEKTISKNSMIDLIEETIVDQAKLLETVDFNSENSGARTIG